MKIVWWQTIYLIGGAIISPFFPLLYLQGQYTRRKVGVLPGAGGKNEGKFENGPATVELLVLGESTVAGLGARTHDRALAGQFAEFLGRQIDRSVSWFAVGKNGVTAEQAIRQLVPRLPDKRFDHILIALGGNDVLKLSSPRKWRRDMDKLLGILRRRNPQAKIFLANCPMIKLSPAIPQPINAILWQLSKLHDANIRDLIGPMENVFYFHQPRDISEGFFADGIHPSEKGYRDWAESMVDFFTANGQLS